MKDRLKRWGRSAAVEQGTLLASLVKWTSLATLAGILAGCSTSAFLWSLSWTIGAVTAIGPRLLLLPPGFLLAYLIVHVFAREAEGHGTDKVIEAVHRRSGRIPLPVAPVKLVATVITIASGGSVGKEGPAAQIGAALASGLASLLLLRRRDHRNLVVCGIGAGFAASGTAPRGAKRCCGCCAGGGASAPPPARRSASGPQVLVQEPAQPRLHLLRHLEPAGVGAERARLAVGGEIRAARRALRQVPLELRDERGRQRAVEIVGEDRDEIAARHAPPPSRRVSCSRSAIRARCSRVFTAATESPTMAATSSLDSSSTSFSTSTAR